jgi:hypothetical protein
MADKATGASSSMRRRLKENPIPSTGSNREDSGEIRSSRPSQRNLATGRRMHVSKPSSESFWCTPTAEETVLNKSLMDVETKPRSDQTLARRSQQKTAEANDRPKWHARLQAAALLMSRRLKKDDILSTSNRDWTRTCADAKNTLEKTKG